MSPGATTFPVQAYVPRRAFDALDIPRLMLEARRAGIDHPRIESSTAKMPPNVPAASTRVTCSLEMALTLVGAFGQIASNAEAREDRELAAASSGAVRALVDGIDAARTTHRLPFGRTEPR